MDEHGAGSQPAHDPAGWLAAAEARSDPVDDFIPIGRRHEWFRQRAVEEGKSVSR